MKYIYDEKKIRYYIDKHHLDLILPDIKSYGKKRVHLSYCEPGETLEWQNESENLVFLVQGSAKNYAVTNKGQKVLLHFSEGFEILRDLELLGIRNQSMVMKAMKDPVFLEVNLKGIKEELLDDPAFLRSMMMQIGKKLANTTVAQVMTATCTTEARLCSYIVHMAQKDENGRLLFRENLVETSELLGTSYRHLLRILSGFCENRVLNHYRRIYEVIDLNWLQEKASDQPIYGRFHE